MSNAIPRVSRLGPSRVQWPTSEPIAPLSLPVTPRQGRSFAMARMANPKLAQLGRISAVPRTSGNAPFGSQKQQFSNARGGMQRRSQSV